MRIVVLYNQPILPQDHPEADSERGVAATVDALYGRLVARGHRVSRLGVGQDLRRLRVGLNAYRPDVVFNLFEGLANRPHTEVSMALLLERLGVNFTGSPSRSLRMALNKHCAKRRFLDAGLPTPWFLAVGRLPLPDVPMPWPVIVKPARRDASEGIDQGSVVTTPDALRRRAAQLFYRYGPPILIEQFIFGREFSVALVEAPELVALPITEVQLPPSNSLRWPILTYQAKWRPRSADYAATPMVHGAALSRPLARSLVTLASRAFHVVGCRDYARVDLRVSRSGEPFILEVNANPDFSPTACFAGALSAARMDWAELAVQFVRQAAVRGIGKAAVETGIQRMSEV